MDTMEVIQFINYSLSMLFFFCYLYQIIYLAVPYVKKLPQHKPVQMHRYAVLISARNEEMVLPHLLASINAQDYPAELVTTFVVADNCTDNTAEAARRAGAVVYERFNKNLVGKGYALNFLLDKICTAYGEDYFDGYFVFDADNLLCPDYITEMNKTFSDGYSVITSYRNSKNYADNWITAGYGLWFLREAKYLNHSRMALGTSCAVSGTGFVFSREIMKKYGGWNFFLLTEDIEFSVRNVIDGERIGYCPTAMLYDEQPVTFKQSWRQRMRWAKGYLQVFRNYGGQLLRGIGGKNCFSCYDMSMAIMPAIVITSLGIICNLTVALIGLFTQQDVSIALQSVTQLLCNTYLFMLGVGALTTISEWKNIRTTTGKKILYTFTFPLFMLTYIPIAFVSLFKKVEWKPIEHKVAMTIEEMNSSI